MSTVIIDRRKNLSDKSISNRQRFIQRSQKAIRKSIEKNLRDKNIEDILGGDTVSVPVKDISEPTFSHSGGSGQHEYVFPGNDMYEEGDAIEKPSGDDGDSGNEAGGEGDGRDVFQFVLSKEEYLNMIFEGLELPWLEEKNLQSLDKFTYHRAGYTISGNPANLNVEQSVMKSMGRRMALHRPSDEEIKELEDKLAEMNAEVDPKFSGHYAAIRELELEIEELKAKQKRIPFFDDMDVRYNHFSRVPEPATKAVMFCLMDVSGSMGDFEKTLAKRFFMLLYLFLVKTYRKDNVEMVFIRHTTDAQEVDEETFFYDPQNGGTLVSSALKEMQKIVKKRYLTSEWNIYAAQVSDGDNFESDNLSCKKLLEDSILEYTQYFAYIQVDRYGSDMIGNPGLWSGGLWNTYTEIERRNFAMSRVHKIQDIWTVFRKLFEKKVLPK